jgi:hypothetical protein
VVDLDVQGDLVGVGGEGGWRTEMGFTSFGLDGGVFGEDFDVFEVL